MNREDAGRDEAARTPRVDLATTLEQVAVLLAFPSGVRYSNQTGGSACFHPELEGILVPIEDETGALHDALTALFEPASATIGRTGLTTATADAIDAMLQAWREHTGLRVDRSRLEASHEAWVHVLAFPLPEDHDLPIYEGFGERTGVLTWRNSD